MDYTFAMASQKEREIPTRVPDLEPFEENNAETADVRVDIFVAQHCFVCEYAYEIAKLIEKDFSEVKLRMIDINDADEVIPEAVFATPTYLLNDQVWSLGNPSPEQVTERLTELLEH